jgi:hypothetical protein
VHDWVCNRMPVALASAHILSLDRLHAVHASVETLLCVLFLALLTSPAPFCSAAPSTCERLRVLCPRELSGSSVRNTTLPRQRPTPSGRQLLAHRT